MRPALKKQPATTIRTSGGVLVDVSTLPNCRNCYNACALKIKCLDVGGKVTRKCARGVL